jgi:hypothetical protein
MLLAALPTLRGEQGGILRPGQQQVPPADDATPCSPRASTKELGACCIVNLGTGCAAATKLPAIW